MNAAERYDRLVLPFVRPFTRPLVDSVDCADEGSVLDHGTGTGEVALAIHRRCPHARVTALDPSADMLEGLRAKAVGVQPWLTIQKGTMASAGFERAFDVCLSQLVLMFVPDPGEELRLLRRAARPGGSLGLVVLRKAESMVPFFAYWSAAQRIVPGAIEPAAYPHHQFSDPDALAALARDAGWLELRTRAVDASRRLSGSTLWRWLSQTLPIRRDSGETTNAASLVDGGATLRAVLLESLQQYRDGDQFQLPIGVWLMNAVASGMQSPAN